MSRQSEIGLAALDAREMAAILGGGDGGESLARDLGRAVGAIAGGIWWFLAHPPEASYSYCKVGY